MLKNFMNDNLLDSSSFLSQLQTQSYIQRVENDQSSTQNYTQMRETQKTKNSSDDNMKYELYEDEKKSSYMK